MSLKEDILSKFTFPTKEVFVPEWGCTVYLRTLPQREIDDLAKKYGGKLTNAQLLAAGLVDEYDQKVFTAAELAGAPSGIVKRLVEELLEHNGTRPADYEDALGN